MTKARGVSVYRFVLGVVAGLLLAGAVLPYAFEDKPDSPPSGADNVDPVSPGSEPNAPMP